MTSVSEVKTALVGAPVGSVLQVDDCVTGLQLLISKVPPVLLRWLKLGKLCTSGRKEVDR